MVSDGVYRARTHTNTHTCWLTWQPHPFWWYGVLRGAWRADQTGLTDQTGACYVQGGPHKPPTQVLHCAVRYYLLYPCRFQDMVDDDNDVKCVREH